jgi:hypothetical protein
MNIRGYDFELSGGVEYRQVLEESRVEMMEFYRAELMAWDLSELRRIKLHKQFSHVPGRELPAKGLFLAAKYGCINANFPGLS